MSTPQLFGRSSSHFTRLPRLFAAELRVPYQFVPIYDMTVLDAAAYADNPALKLPILRTPQGVLFGAQNICRAIAERADDRRRIIWPQDLQDTRSRNAQELVWHCMAGQVQLVFGATVANLPADNLYFVKARAGIEGALRWLDTNLQETLAALPEPRTLSMLEASLFCAIEHFRFRKTIDVERYGALLRFAAKFGERDSAASTPYMLDVPPAS